MRHAKRVGIQRKARGYRVRNALKKHLTRPRLCVFRSHKNMYVQIIDDAQGKTLVSASTQDKEVRESASYGGNKAAATVVGQVIAKRALAAGLKQVCFDRREYKYHGRVAAVADAARDAGLDLGAKKEIVEAAVAKKGKGGKDGGKEKGGKEKGEKPAKEKAAKPKKEKEAQAK